MAYGSGTLFQKGKKGIWYYQAFSDGKRIGPLSARTTDRKKAQLQLDKLLGRRARGELAQRSQADTLGQLLDAYIEFAQRNRKKSTAYIYRVTIEAHLREPFGKMRVTSLTLDRMKRYRLEREKLGVSPVTINRELACLRGAMNLARKEGALTFLPYFPMVKEDNARKVWVTESDFLRFFCLLIDDLKAFAATAYYGGLRRGELLRLQPEDIHMEEGWLEIREAKNGEARAVPILDGLMRDCLESALRSFKPGQKRLFYWRAGHPITARNFYKEWHKARIAAGIEDFIPHDSRRSANRNLREDGVPKELRMGVMGWKSDAMERRYGISEPAAHALQVKAIVERKTASKIASIDSRRVAK